MNTFRFRLLVLTSLFLFLAWITCGMIWRFPAQGNTDEATAENLRAWVNVASVVGLLAAHAGLFWLKKWARLLLVLCVISFLLVGIFEPPVTISALTDILNTSSDMVTGALISVCYFTPVLLRK